MTDMLPVQVPNASKIPAPTEGEVLDLLRARYTRTGNGGAGEYAVLTHVRDAAAFDAKRTIDAVVVSLWPSRGLTLDGYEVKVSRSDWQRELAKPDKAEDTCRLVDRFWIAAPTGVVQPGELPPTWGLIEVVGGKAQPDTSLVVGRKLKVVTPAPMLHAETTRTKPVSRDLLVGLLRAAEGAVAQRVNAEQSGLRTDAVEAYERGRRDQEQLHESTLAEVRARMDAAEAAITGFEQAAGVKLGEWRRWTGARGEEVGRALRIVLDGGDMLGEAEARVRELTEWMRNQADRLDDGRKTTRW